MTRNFRRGITVDAVDYSHLRGRLETEALLEDLGIDFSHWEKEHQAMAHCPNLLGYHENGDRNPSFGFNDEKLAFNCFGGCYKGNVIELVQLMKPEYAHRFEHDLERDQAAVTYLEKFADFSVEVSLADKIGTILNPKKEAPAPMPDYPLENLFKFRKIHPYLYERGLTKDVIVEMQVGFDDIHCGIVIPHIFQGKLRGWQTRHLAQDREGNFLCDYCERESGESMARGKVGKYKNTRHFPKVNTLYGYDQMKEALRAEAGHSVIVVESPMTALKLKSWGFNRIVATFGSFSQEQGMLLIAVPTVYFWPDNDYAGYQNALACITGLGTYTTVKIVPAVPGKKSDAADIEDIDGVMKYLQNAYFASLFKLYSKDNKLATLEDLRTLIGDSDDRPHAVERDQTQEG